MTSQPHEDQTARPLTDAEGHTPPLLQRFLADLEGTETALDVWRLVVALGRRVDLPFVDMISAHSYADWRRTLFVRTSYDSRWLNAANTDPDIARWSYFRSHAVHRLTPIAVGIEYADEYLHLPEKRMAVLREAARRGMRAGFSIPMRQAVPAQAGLIAFFGNHSRRACNAIIRTHGWTLNVAALAAYQRYMSHFHAEFPRRNKITAKQAELLELIGRGLQDKQIADALGISISAVR